jgi:hypothetical protein
MADSRYRRVVIIHNHLFKNAGSTIDWGLRKNFGAGFVDHRNDDDMKQGDVYLKTFLLANPKIKAISTHQLTLPLPAIDGVFLPQILMFRHPVERITSVYNFEKRQKGVSTPGAISAKKYGLKSYVEWRMQPTVGATIRNFHFRKCLPPRRYQNKPFTDEEKNFALGYVTSIEMLGLVDRFDESMVLFESFLSDYYPSIDLSYVAQNIGQTKKQTSEERIAALKERVGNETFDLILQNNQEDLMLYNAAVELFEERLTKVPDFKKKLVDFRQRCGRLKNSSAM